MILLFVYYFETISWRFFFITVVQCLSSYFNYIQYIKYFDIKAIYLCSTSVLFNLKYNMHKTIFLSINKQEIKFHIIYFFYLFCTIIRWKMSTGSDRSHLARYVLKVHLANGGEYSSNRSLSILNNYFQN